MEQRFEDADLEDWSDTGTTQGVPTTSRSWKRPRTDSPLPEGVPPADILVFRTINDTFLFF